MKKCVLRFLIIAQLAILSGCGNSEGDYEPYRLKIDTDSPKSLSIDDYFVAVRYIPLETTNEAVMGSVEKIIRVNDRHYFQTESHELFIFDLEGNYLGKISNRGRGPGEYFVIEDFDVCKDGDIYIWDWTNREMHIYDSTGSWNRNVKIDLGFINFRFLGNNRILAYCDRAHSYQIAIIDLESTDIEYSLPWQQEQSDLRPLKSERLSDRSTGFFFTLRGDDRIYSAKDGAIKIVAEVDFGENKKTSSDRERERTISFDDIENRPLSLFNSGNGNISHYLDFPDFATFLFRTGVVNIRAIWDKEKEEIFFSAWPDNTISTIPMLANTNTPNSTLHLVSSRYFLSLLDKQEDKANAASKFIGEHYESLTIQSNPVIIEYIIK
jgi:hypothetical protein